MPILPVSPGRHMVRVTEVLMRGTVLMLGLVLAVVVFIPLVPALLFWPLLPWDRVLGVLELFRGWVLSLIRSAGPDVPDEDHPVGAARSRARRRRGTRPRANASTST